MIVIGKRRRTGAKDPGGWRRSQREVENEVSDKAMESDVGCQRQAAIQSATVQFLEKKKRERTNPSGANR